MNGKGHIPDPLRRLKLQLELLLESLDLKTSRSIAKAFDLHPRAVKDFFHPEAKLNERTFKVLYRIATELGLDLVVAPQTMLDALPNDAQAKIHQPKPSRSMHGVVKGSIYAHLQNED